MSVRLGATVHRCGEPKEARASPSRANAIRLTARSRGLYFLWSSAVSFLKVISFIALEKRELCHYELQVASDCPQATLYLGC
jgi:hypothetical protein